MPFLLSNLIFLKNRSDIPQNITPIRIHYSEIIPIPSIQ